MTEWEQWQARERELLTRNTELVEKLRAAEAALDAEKRAYQNTIIERDAAETKLAAFEGAARKMREALRGLIKYHLSMRQVQHADKLLADALGEGETKGTNPKTTIHSYSCGCKLTAPYDGVTEEIHKHPCPKHGGHT